MLFQISLVNISLALHDCHFDAAAVDKVRILKFYSNSNFQVYSIILLTVVTMLYLRSLELIHFITESLYPLTNISPFSHPSAPGNHHCTLYFYEFNVFRFHLQGRSHSSCLCLTTSLRICPQLLSMLL